MKRYDTYKDSGVQWLGEIPGHWECVPFKSVFELGKGLSITKEDLKDSGVKVISYGQIHSKNNKFSYVVPELYRYVDESYLTNYPQSLANKEDFLFADTSEDMVGSGNFVRIDNEETTFAGYHTIIARNKKAQNGNYLAYLLQSNKWKMQIWVQVHGVKLFSITRSILNSTKLLLPPLSEQRSIVSFLDAKCGKIDEWVTKKQKEVEHLQELKQRVIADAVTRGLNPHVKMKATNIPWLKEIPEHWERNKVIRLFKQIGSGTTPSSGDASLYADEGTPWLQSGDFNNNEINSTSKFLTDKALDNYSLKLYNSGGVVIAMYGASIGKVGLLNIATTVNQACCVLSDSDHLLQKFSFYVFINEKDNLVKKSKGGTQPNISQEIIKSHYIPVPPLSEQRSIVSYLDAKCSKIDKLIANVTKEIECIKEYKQRLISDVVTGQIKVC